MFVNATIYGCAHVRSVCFCCLHRTFCFFAAKNSDDMRPGGSVANKLKITSTFSLQLRRFYGIFHCGWMFIRLKLVFFLFASSINTIVFCALFKANLSLLFQPKCNNKWKSLSANDIPINVANRDIFPQWTPSLARVSKLFIRICLAGQY